MITTANHIALNERVPDIFEVAQQSDGHGKRIACAKIKAAVRPINA
jgi:hypothetical protein